MSSNKHFQVEDKDMTKQENDDPEWNPRIQFGEIASQINQLLDKGKDAYALIKSAILGR